MLNISFSGKWTHFLEGTKVRETTNNHEHSVAKGKNQQC